MVINLILKSFLIFYTQCCFCIQIYNKMLEQVFYKQHVWHGVSCVLLVNECTFVNTVHCECVLSWVFIPLYFSIESAAVWKGRSRKNEQLVVSLVQYVMMILRIQKSLEDETQTLVYQNSPEIVFCSMEDKHLGEGLVGNSEAGTPGRQICYANAQVYKSSQFLCKAFYFILFYFIYLCILGRKKIK